MRSRRHLDSCFEMAVLRAFSNTVDRYWPQVDPTTIARMDRVNRIPTLRDSCLFSLIRHRDLLGKIPRSSCMSQGPCRIQLVIHDKFHPWKNPCMCCRGPNAQLADVGPNQTPPQFFSCTGVKKMSPSLNIRTPHADNVGVDMLGTYPVTGPCLNQTTPKCC